MEAMYVSIEVLTTLGSFAGLLVAVVSGFAWVIRRTDAQVEHATNRLEARMDRLEDRMDRLEDRMDRLGDRMDRLQGELGGLARELTEVKIAVARLEGPLPRLVPAR